VRRRVLAVLLLTALGAVPDARAAAPASCGAEDPAITFTGTFTSDQTGSFVLLPFEVPPGTTAIRAWYCHDQPELPSADLPAYAIRHTLDFGFRGPKGFRGWSGSGFDKAITVSPEGFGTTTHGYRPGPITPGTWRAELGVAAVVGQSQGDLDGSTDWRVELRLETDPSYADEPYAPARYDARPAKAAPGWYAGDFHVHTDQSGDAKTAEPAKVFDHAFKTAGLDFVQATDHNTDGGWREWGRYQGAHPGKLIARNAEITTYRGHVNAPGLRRLVDYRTGPVYERRPDGTLAPVRPARPVSDLFDDVHAAKGVTTINHPTIFDAAIPPFAIVCRGCSWEYTDAETQYAKVDAVEVETGPQGLKTDLNTGPNPFTPLALDFYEHAIEAGGRRIAVVSGSDSHSGGDSDVTDVTGTPVGSPATMVYANELSERGIADAVAAGHTYVRSFGLRSPELRLEAAADGQPPAMMGDTVHAAHAGLSARVIGKAAGPEPLTLVVLRDGQPLSAVPVTSEDFTYRFGGDAPHHYGILLQRGTAIEAFATPVFLTTEAAAPAAAPLRVNLHVDRRLRGRAVRVRCGVAGTDVRSCRVVVRRGGRTLGARTVRMVAGATRFRVVLRGRAPRARLTATALDGAGTRARTVRRVRFRR
jgi:hypothetical protein